MLVSTAGYAGTRFHSIHLTPAARGFACPGPAVDHASESRYVAADVQSLSGRASSSLCVCPAAFLLHQHSLNLQKSLKVRQIDTPVSLPFPPLPALFFGGITRSRPSLAPSANYIVEKVIRGNFWLRIADAYPTGDLATMCDMISQQVREPMHIVSQSVLTV